MLIYDRGVICTMIGGFLRRSVLKQEENEEQDPGVVEGGVYDEDFLPTSPREITFKKEEEDVEVHDSRGDNFNQNPRLGQSELRKSSFLSDGRKVSTAKHSWIFQKAIHFYADRKYIMVAFIHLAITMVIFSEYDTFVVFDMIQ